MATPPKPPFELPQSDNADPLTREALAWLVHLHSGEEKSEDWAAFEEWQASSDRHRKAGIAAKQLWEQIGPALVRQRKSRNRIVPTIVAGAVGLAAIAFAAGLFGPPAAFFADYRSATGELRTVTLHDGSRIDLDTGTSFDVRDGGRTVELYSGQVFVTVNRDPARPFTVIAGANRIQALGTAFAVRRDGDETTVVVTEHAVRVSAPQGASPGAARRDVEVVAGQTVTASQTAGVGTPRPADVETMTAWRHGELVFRSRPLGNVIAELQRYRRGRIVVFDSSINRWPVTGNIDIRNSDAFLESLQQAMPVRVVAMPGFVAVWRDSSRDTTR